MLTALVVIAVLAVGGMAASGLAARSASARRTAEVARAQGLESEIRAAADASKAAEERAGAAEARAATAEERAAAADERAAAADERAAAADERAREAGQRVQDAEQRAVEAEQRAVEAEQRAQDSEQRARQAERRAQDAEHRAPAGGAQGSAPDDQTRALWDLERLRLEREWRDVAGPSVPLPLEWDGGVAPALAVELEVIREVVGTPSRLECAGVGPTEPGTALAVTRAAGEVLRHLARAGLEMDVAVEGGPCPVVRVRSGHGEGEADLSHLDAAVAALGGTLEQHRPSPGELVVELRLPAAGAPEG